MQNIERPSRASSVFGNIRRRFRSSNRRENSPNEENRIYEVDTSEEKNSPFEEKQIDSSNIVHSGIKLPKFLHGFGIRNKNDKVSDNKKDSSIIQDLAAGDSSANANKLQTNFTDNEFTKSQDEARLHEQKYHSSYRDSCSYSKTRSKMGFIENNDDESTSISYIAFLNVEPADMEYIKEIMSRRFHGLEQQYNCRISISDKPCKMRARTGYMLEIKGSNSRDVAKCRNSLPKTLTDKLITKNENTNEEMLSMNL